MKTHTDEEIIQILRKHPQHGMELLVESYTGLIWKVISFHLNNPEDIKECVNDTFAEFYFRRNSYDAGKASLPIYLTAIARHLSISRYRKEKKQPQKTRLTEIRTEDPALLLAEIQADLSRALDALKPNELQIIQMKYYGGMTIAEIAQSLDLPYETVKKRHQRSISKLRHALLITLLLLLLFSFCTYAVLRHFDIIPPLFPQIETNGSVEEPDNRSRIAFHIPDIDHAGDKNTDEDVSLVEPASAAGTTTENIIEAGSFLVSENYTYISGYGVKEVSDIPSFTLHSTVSAEDDATTISVTSASLVNKRLRITISAYSKTKPFSIDPELFDTHLGQDLMRVPDGSTHHLFYHGQKVPCPTQTVNDIENRYMQTEIFEYNDFEVMDSDAEQIPFTVHCYDLDLSFTLVPATEEKISDNNTNQMKEYGGLLVLPKLEDGSLKVSIHPLNTGDFLTLPGLIRGARGEYYPDGLVTVTDENENTLNGRCIRYYPGSTSTYFVWDFGEADPGTYTLHIPYVFQIPAKGEKLTIPVNFTDRIWEKKQYEISGATIWISDITEPYDLPKDNYRYAAYEDSVKYWGTEDFPGSYSSNPDNYIYQDMTFSYDTGDDNHQLECLYIDTLCDYDSSFANWPAATSEYLSTDSSSHTITYRVSFLKNVDLPATTRLEIQPSTQGSFTGTPGYYRWNESFHFTFTVE